VANVSVVALRVREGPMPVPESAMECGLPDALSVIARAADSAVLLAGVKVTLKVVLLFGAMVSGSVTGGSEKSLEFVPAMETFDRTRLSVPVLLIVIATGALVVPTF